MRRCGVVDSMLWRPHDLGSWAHWPRRDLHRDPHRGLPPRAYNTTPFLSLMCPLMPMIDCCHNYSLFAEVLLPVRDCSPIACDGSASFLRYSFPPSSQKLGACLLGNNKALPRSINSDLVARPSTGWCRNLHGWDLLLVKSY